jgi:dipeptidyl aminopeptidase/acylaminoacyl peptidase
VTPDGFSARTLVHEYGGGHYFLHGDVVFFSNMVDQRLYRQEPGAGPRPITPDPSPPFGLRYADGDVTLDGRLIVSVREFHRDGAEAVNELVAFAADGSSAPHAIVRGHDFFSTPRISPDGKQLAWLCWDHPNMPWDGTELWVANLGADGALSGQRMVAGGREESIFQPAWSPDNVLHFVSDRSNWWNLYREKDGKIEHLAPKEAEFGQPQWVFGQSRYDFLPDGRIACIYSQDGIDYLGLVSADGQTLTPLATDFTAIGTLHALGDHLWFIAGSPTLGTSIVGLNPASGAADIARQGEQVDVDPTYFSAPRPVEFPTDNGLTAHALFYPPHNPDFAAPPGEEPPLLVISHGGPTSATKAVLDLEIQFWTTRGFGVVDVNYGGSTGYGRDYRQRLNGEWGIVDVVDCINAAKYLIAQGEADGARVAVRGGSAGGYTTLCGLAFHDFFAAGASYYGVADLGLLATDTHKFESRYLDSMVGPYPAMKDVYDARSPLNYADQISCPIILFQGLEDKVVTPNQAEKMVEALRQSGTPFAYIPFEGEQHGFRKAETIIRAAEAELYFYSKVFDFSLPEPVEPVRIENL